MQTLCLEGKCASRAAHLWNAPANELGDTLAGIAGALAFVWLAVAVFLQKTELALQRQELAAQRAEWEKMSEALEAQARVFEDEQRERAERRSDREFDAMLDLLGRQLWDREGKSHYWFWTDPITGGDSLTIFRDHPAFKGDEKIRQTMRHVAEVANRVSSQQDAYETRPDRDVYERVSNLLSELVRLQESMSGAGRWRAGDLSLAAAHDAMRKLLETKRAWGAEA